MTQGLQALPEPKPKRFSVSYHLLALRERRAARAAAVLGRRRRARADSVVPVWPTADWHEREQYDLMGIAFDGHPNLERILLDDDWEGHPLRKDYPIGGEPVRFSDERMTRERPARGPHAPMADRRRAALRGLAHPGARSRRSSTSRRSCADTDDVLQVNFGPNHPSTHGVLRLIVDLDGEDVVGLEAVIGYLHTGFEKTMEQKTWWKAITYPERIDYVGYQNNELVVRARDREAARARGAREGDVDAHAPVRAEPHPLASRVARHVGARARGDLDVLVLLPRARADPRPVRARRRPAHAHALLPGRRRSPRTSRRASSPRRASSSSGCRTRSTTTSTLLDRNQIWLERTDGHRAALRRRRDRARPVRAGAARIRRRLGPPPRPAVPRLRPGRLPRPGLPGRRRLRPLPRAHGRDGGVGEDRRASASTGWSAWRGSRGSPTTARSCCRRARSSTPRWSRSSTTSRSSPRASACPRARSTSRSSRRAASPAATSCSRRRPEAVARALPRAVVRRARRRPRPACTDALIADLIAIVGSLDTVMGDTDR